VEKMPYRSEPNIATPLVSTGEPVASDWRSGLPSLHGHLVTLRELRASDAASLCALLTTEEVARFVSPPPTTVEGFERFISWTRSQRIAGTYVCYAVTLRGFRYRDRHLPGAAAACRLRTAEWGFAIGSAFWGTGGFRRAPASCSISVFDTLGVHRLEARASVLNARGNGALVKVGAVQECQMRKSFIKDGEHFDQALYSILATDHRRSRLLAGSGSRRIH